MPPSSTSSSESQTRADPRADSRGLLAALATIAALALGGLVSPEPLTRNLAGERVPYRVEVHELDARWVADAGPRSRHAANGQGLRGDVIVGRDFEVVIVGGSTTECSLLDEGEDLVGRLARELDERVDEPVRVAALAQPGLPLFGLLDELDAFTHAERRPDRIVAFVGANETQTFFNHAPWVAREPGGPWEAWIDPDSAFGVRGRATTYRGWYQPGSGGRFLDAVRVAYADERNWQRSLHPGHHALLRQALRDYVASLAGLHALARARGATLVLVTQPLAPWAPPAEGRGWAPFLYAPEGAGFVPSPELSAQLLDAFNAQTRGFASEHQLPLVDLARTMADCTTCFYDQWHFTNEGAERAAGAIADLDLASSLGRPE